MRLDRLAALTLAPLLLATVAFVRPAGAQTPAPKDQPTFQEKIEVTEVVLDALVTDAQGHVIVGLKKDDFVVKADGKPVELTSVTFYSDRTLKESSAALAAKGIQVDATPSDRYFVLFFDDQTETSSQVPGLLARQVESSRRTRDWIAHELLPNDWVAVVGYDRKLKIYEDFTHDRGALDSAVQAALKARDAERNYPSRQGLGQEAGAPSLVAYLPVGDALRDQTTTIYDALRLLSASLGHITGRKNLLLFTLGFGRINNIGVYEPDQRYYPKMVNALNTNNVAVYTIDMLQEGYTHIMSDAMNQLALDTGGRYFFNVVNFMTPLKQASEENSGYYLLSFRGEHKAGSSGFQQVEVKMANPELKVRARKGYSFGK
ncbi:MAG TPA: VWA domain-containing protein, partial [Thermoanaerobaculia bacterium]